MAHQHEVDAGASKTLFGGKKSYFFGANIPGKPRRYLLNSGGRPKLFAVINDVRENDFQAFRLSRSSRRPRTTVQRS